MKRLMILAFGFLCLLPCRDAWADKSLYFLGGLTVSNLGGDAEAFGDALAASVESENGGTWTSDKKTRSGFDVGVGYAYSKKASAGVAAEVHYAKRGVNWELNETSGSGVRLNTAFNLAYVEIPVLLQVTSETASKTRPLFLVGPVLGIRASSNLEVSGGGASGSADISSGMKSTYFGGLFGAGVDIRVAEKSSLLLQARFLLGLTNLVDDPTFDTKVKDFSFHAGYAMRL